jgi:hypothetical protein
MMVYLACLGSCSCEVESHKVCGAYSNKKAALARIRELAIERFNDIYKGKTSFNDKEYELAEMQWGYKIMDNYFNWCCEYFQIEEFEIKEMFTAEGQ